MEHLTHCTIKPTSLTSSFAEQIYAIKRGIRMREMFIAEYRKISYVLNYLINRIIPLSYMQLNGVNTMALL